MTTLLPLLLSVNLIASTSGFDVGGFSFPQFPGLPAFSPPASSEADTQTESDTTGTASQSASTDASTGQTFTSQEADSLGNITLPGFLKQVNSTEVVHNLTSAEANMAQLKSKNAATVTSSSNEPSESEVAQLTSTVQSHLSEMTSLEQSINTFEEAVSEFESSMASQSASSSSSSSSTTSSTGLSDDDLTKLKQLETSLNEITAQVQKLEAKKQNISSRLNEISATMESAPQPKLTESEAHAFKGRLDHLETKMSSQSSTLTSSMEQFQQQCSKIDQHPRLFPSSGGRVVSSEDNYIPLTHASQSSVSGSNVALRSIDGEDKYPYEYYLSCSKTLVEESGNPWYMVELSEISLVTRVEITTMYEYPVNMFPLQVDGFTAFSYGQYLGQSLCFQLTSSTIRGGKTLYHACDEPIVAKYVKLTRALSYTYLALCEIRVLGHIDYSPHGKMDITQSSTNSLESKASRSSDGVIYTCSMTSLDPLDSAPWWQIDMKMERTLEALVITNRRDGYYVNLKKLTVLVYPGLPSACGTTEPVQCAYYDEWSGIGASITIPCDKPVKGRTIRIVRDGTGLSICEIELKLLD